MKNIWTGSDLAIQTRFDFLKNDFSKTTSGAEFYINYWHDSPDDLKYNYPFAQDFLNILDEILG